MSNLETGLVESSRMQKIIMLIAVVFPFLGLVSAIILMWFAGWMSWLYLGLFLGGWLITALGITVGYHRLLTHRSFETSRWLRAGWASVGAMAAQGPPLIWTAIHRKHHERSDKPGDPHTPHQHGTGFWNAVRGFVHSHVGWMFTLGWSAEETKRYVPDLQKDRLLRGISRTYAFWFFLGLTIPTLIGFLVAGGWKGALLGFLWGGMARIFILHHATWSVNSICHMFGRQDYESADHSRNNIACGLLAYGEGWHNNHHAFPTSARHGLKWWQFDLSWLVIRAMKLLGLAWNVRTPSPEAMESKRLDGLQPAAQPVGSAPAVASFASRRLGDELAATSLPGVNDGRNVIRTSIELINRFGERAVHRLMEYLGGTATVGGYAFPSVDRRDAALQVLVEKYGSGYFSFPNC